VRCPGAALGGEGRSEEDKEQARADSGGARHLAVMGWWAVLTCRARTQEVEKKLHTKLREDVEVAISKVTMHKSLRRQLAFLQNALGKVALESTSGPFARACLRVPSHPSPTVLTPVRTAAELIPGMVKALKIQTAVCEQNVLAAREHGDMPDMEEAALLFHLVRLARRALRHSRTASLTRPPGGRRVAPLRQQAHGRAVHRAAGPQRNRWLRKG
jgi:hypothetical protein